MRCPTCKRKFDPGNPYAPFCSERCKLVDLGKWLDGEFRVPGEPASLPEVLPEEGLPEEDPEDGGA